MAVDNGAVFAQHEKPHGSADDVAAADHNALFAVKRYAVFAEHLHDTRGRTGPQGGLARYHFADVQGVERVDILVGAYGVDHRALVDVPGQRELNEDAVNAAVAVELIDERQKIFLRGAGGKVESSAVDTAFEAVALLVADVYLRGRIVPDQHRGKTGLSGQLRRLAGHLRAYLLRKLFSVNKHCHNIIPASRVK